VVVDGDPDGDNGSLCSTAKSSRVSRIGKPICINQIQSDSITGNFSQVNQVNQEVQVNQVNQEVKILID